jgi:hypothetical protein
MSSPLRGRVGFGGTRYSAAPNQIDCAKFKAPACDGVGMQGKGQNDRRSRVAASGLEQEFAALHEKSSRQNLVYTRN